MFFHSEHVENAGVHSGDATVCICPYIFLVYLDLFSSYCLLKNCMWRQSSELKKYRQKLLLPWKWQGNHT